MSRKLKHTYRIIASYPDGDKTLKIVSDFETAFRYYSDIVELRVFNYMSFRGVRLVSGNSVTRVLFEFKDYRYIQTYHNEEIIKSI